MYFGIFLQLAVTKNLNQLVFGTQIGSLLCTTEQAMFLRTSFCSFFDSAPSAAGAAGDDEDDGQIVGSRSRQIFVAFPIRKSKNINETIEGQGSVSCTATKNLKVHTETEGSQSMIFFLFEHLISC